MGDDNVLTGAALGAGAGAAVGFAVGAGVGTRFHRWRPIHPWRESPGRGWGPPAFTTGNRSVAERVGVDVMGRQDIDDRNDGTGVARHVTTAQVPPADPGVRLCLSWDRVRAHLIWAAAWTGAACAVGPAPGAIDTSQSPSRLAPVTVDTLIAPAALALLGQSVGASRIVLIGENGHGVSEFTTIKSGLVRYFHEHLGFDVLAVESGYYECASVGERLATIPPANAVRQCAAYAFEHAELLPLFRYARATQTTLSPLRLAGLDFQVQGADSRSRPAYLRAALQATGWPAADAVARADSVLQAKTAAGGDSLRAWVAADGPPTQALVEAAAATVSGAARWTLRSISALLERLSVRASAEEMGVPPPVGFYALRDAWMARTVQWLADSTGPPRKVIVWLHNDHARLGSWDTPSGPARATGGLLHDAFPGMVYSIGLFMGSGTVANNSRQPRPMVASVEGSLEQLLSRPGEPAGYTVVRDARGAWTQRVVPYLRNGLAVDSLVPAMEFDAVFFVATVRPATYRLP